METADITGDVAAVSFGPDGYYLTILPNVVDPQGHQIQVFLGQLGSPTGNPLLDSRVTWDGAEIVSVADLLARLWSPQKRVAFVAHINPHSYIRCTSVDFTTHPWPG